jgi:NitT/TauT family transport system permease protein
VTPDAATQGFDSGIFGAVALILIALVVMRVSRGWSDRIQKLVLPLMVTTIMVAVWQMGCDLLHATVFPTPWQTLLALIELIESDRLLGDSAASLYRVTWGFFLATVTAIPLGLVVGWSTRSFWAMNPVIQGLRPISPIAWIPMAILWFGIGDGAGIYLIFLSSFFPICVGTMAGVRNISLVHQRSAANFGIHGIELIKRVVLPGAMPQIITSLRIALGVAWLVIVAAEMVGMDSGLGYLINDARNMGSRYDLVAAVMIVIGVIGIVLDLLIRRLERFDEVRWGYAER